MYLLFICTIYLLFCNTYEAETGEPKSYQFLLQGIAVAVQRGNAASIRGTAHVVDDVFI